MLAKDFGVSSEIWSVTSFTELRRDGLEVDRWNMLHPEAAARVSYVEQALGQGGGPVIAATDYIEAIPDGIRPFVPARYKALGTDGFGRSDYRRKLRSFFEVDRWHVAVAALTLGLLMWLVAFLGVGGEWFLMWQSKTWNGQEAAFRMFTVLGVVLLLVTQPDSDLQP